MPETAPEDMGMVGRRQDWRLLTDFATTATAHPGLGLVWGRRRIGKSYLLSSLAQQTGGFYFGAVRGSKSEALRELGEALALDQGAPAPLTLTDWTQAVDALLHLGNQRPRLVVLDEYPYLREHSPELDSVIQRAYGPRAAAGTRSQARLVLCGSAMTVMRELLNGTAPLRGRAGLDLRMLPFDFREARDLHGIADLETAVRTYAVIGGVAAYARDMVDGDLPSGRRDFDRWVCRRVLSPAAPLSNEVGLLLSENPETSKARRLNLYHATLAGIAGGNHAHSKLTRYLKTSGPSLAPVLDALISAELVRRIPDPLRENRPTYQPGDQILRFHYAVLRLGQGRLARAGDGLAAEWSRLRPTFESRVLGPSFEDMARFWTAHFAEAETLGGSADHVGSSVIEAGPGPVQLDVVATVDDAESPSRRTVAAIGEAKVGETLTPVHLQRLESARQALGRRGEQARLLLFGARFSATLRRAAAARTDVVLVDLERLYGVG